MFTIYSRQAGCCKQAGKQARRQAVSQSLCAYDNINSMSITKDATCNLPMYCSYVSNTNVLTHLVQSSMWWWYKSEHWKLKWNSEIIYTLTNWSFNEHGCRHTNWQISFNINVYYLIAWMRACVHLLRGKGYVYEIIFIDDIPISW